MRLNILLGLLEKQRKKAGNDDRVFPAERFHRILQRERRRSDRNHHGFSLVTFVRNDGCCGHVLEEEVVPVLVKRVRASDVVGWLGDDVLGVFLPETSQAGASKLLADIVEVAPLMMERTLTRVYTYPFHWFWGEEPGIINVSGLLGSMDGSGFRRPHWTDEPPLFPGDAVRADASADQRQER